MRKAKCEFLKNLSSLICSSKQFWSVHHSLSPKGREFRKYSTMELSLLSLQLARPIYLSRTLLSCFTRPPTSVSHDPPLPPANEAGLSSVSCSPKEVHKLLSTLKIKTASGPNGLSSHMLRNTATAIASSLSNLFNLSLSSGVVPSEWKLSNVTPVYKGSGDQKYVTNYRSISLLSLISKVLERVVHSTIKQSPLITTVWLPSQQLISGSPACCHQ